MNWKIYHNPRCSKSRETLGLLEENGINPQIILYLENSPSFKELQELAAKLNLSPTQMVRKKEELYRSLNLESASEEELFKAMSQYPKLMERPIVVCGDRAVLGRPPENVLKLMD